MMQVNPHRRPATDEKAPLGAEPPDACCSGLAGLLSPRLFRALADPTRLALLVRLAEGGGPFTVSQMAQGSGVDMSVVSRHLASLREAGIITCAKRGKEVLCSVQTGAVARMLRDLADALEACCPAGTCRTEPNNTPVPMLSRPKQPRSAAQS